MARMRWRSARGKLGIPLIIVLSLVLAACGSSGSDDAATADGESAAEEDPTSADSGGDENGDPSEADALAPGDPIRIGISGPTSGETAVYAPLPLSTEAYLNYINDQGGVNGYTFEVEVLNNSSTAAGGASSVRQLMNSEPFALVVNGSPVYAAAVSAVEESGDPTIPVFVTASATVIRSVGYENGYGLNPPYESECAYQVQYAKDVLGLDNIAIAWQDDGVGQGVGADCVPFAEEAGFSTVTSIGVPPDTTDFGSYASRIVESGAEVTLGYMFTKLFVGLQTAADAVGYDGEWMTFSTNDLSYAKLAGDLSEGVYVTQFLTPSTVDTPATQLFRSEVVERVGEEATDSLGAMGWTFGAIIARAVEIATESGDSLTRQGFLDALNGLSGEEIGLSPSVDYTDDKSTVVSSLPLYQFKNGQFVQVQEPTPLP